MDEPGLKHHSSNRTAEETEQFSLRKVQLNWLSPWYGGRVGEREDREGNIFDCTQIIYH